MGRIALAVVLAAMWASFASAGEGTSPGAPPRVVDSPSSTYEPPAVPVCPEGYVFDEKLGTCLGKPSCPPGGEYNPARKRCESAPVSISCPEGMNYDKGTDKCVAKPVR